MTVSPPSVSAVLPAFNEEAVISDVVRSTASALARHVSRFEVIVVDDGSHDDTAELARNAVPDADVKVITHPFNRGYGAALRTGFDAAGCEATWLMDADGQFDPADVGLLLPHYAADAVVAGRRIDRQDGALRILNNRAFFGVVRGLFGSVAADVNCAFKLFPAAVGRGLRSDGAMISTELLLRARRSGYRVVEVGVPHHPRRAGQATGSDPRVVMRAFGELWRLRKDPSLLGTVPPPDA
ncbi:MAG TPA: glycosyltransferase family 2 protein [Candidatus Dormibacteraeota bacterium]|nr:glycosyltransferase family 2 protein [Candidatus Dormibacteraeota bacterium]